MLQISIKIWRWWEFLIPPLIGFHQKIQFMDNIFVESLQTSLFFCPLGWQKFISFYIYDEDDESTPRINFLTHLNFLFMEILCCCL